MSTSLASRPIRIGRRSTIATIAVATLATSWLAAPPAESAPPTPAVQDPQCAEAYPVASLVSNQPVHGMTVSSGTTPDPFTGSVLGVLKDGIAPGIDMIMVRLTSSEIDRVGGIWAGMSGSPVYAEDGRLIGAVAYGWSVGPSPVAGVTPAAAMQELLDGGPTPLAASAKDKVALPDRTADRLVEQGYATRAEVNGGLQRLPLAFGVTGMANAKRLQQFAKHFGLDNVRIYNAGGGSSAAPSDEIVAGGNIAITLAYGDFTAGGVGTATQVCGDEVIAFGHPAYWTGPSSASMHGADAIYVQEDPTTVPFKVANITDAVGGIVDDRTAGIHGYVDQFGPTAVFTSDVVSSDGASRHGVSYTAVEDVIPDVAAFHLLANLDRVFDGIGEGSARVRMTVEGLRANGRPFEMSRVDLYASSFDITYESIFDSYEQLYRLLNNRFQDVTITDVSFRAFVDRDYREYRIGAVKKKVGANWVKIDPRKLLNVRPGQLLRLRLTLNSLAGDASKTVDLSVRIPAGTAGNRGSLRILGGAWVFGGPGASSFDDLLTKLENAPHNNDVLLALRIGRPGPDVVSKQTTKFSDVVNGGTQIRIRVVK